MVSTYIVRDEIRYKMIPEVLSQLYFDDRNREVDV